MSRIKVMVVDDHEVVRTGLKAILEPEEDLVVVGEAGNAQEAVERTELLQPHVVLMDVRMGQLNGIEACRLIKSAHPEVEVLMLTSFAEEEAVMASIMAGACGYLLKNVGRADLLKAVRSVAIGQSLLDPAVTKTVIERLAQLEAEGQDRLVQVLTEREKEVLRLIARGLTNRQIADTLVVSEHMVRNHVTHILEKLNLSRRSEAATFAAQHGLLGDEAPYRCNRQDLI